jgi:dTDP-4-dehydrorhamnose 3,5-epimerase
MKFKVEEIFIPDVKIITSSVFEDERGFFMEAFNKKEFDQLGIPTNFVQLNHSRSDYGVVRGLHFQWEPPMGKLMRVTVGEAFLVAVDIRKNSPTLGKWWGGIFSEENKKQIWAPAGFARGICSLSKRTEVQYLITGEWNKSCESEILWNDPDIGINWPIKNPMLSEKDSKAKTFKQWLESKDSNNFML